MQEFDKIGEDLFNKIRGRFPSITIGNETGEVINEPTQARFFDFEYKEGDNILGNVSVNITEDSGMTIIFSKDFISNEDQLTKDKWYSFLKELRLFAKKRMMEFAIRDITKSNLTKRDYKFLSKKQVGDEPMAESKLYGTSKISYQDIDNARLVIKHTESVNQEQASGRTRSVGKIYIESADGERFMYPYKHLNGARAMGRHVAEGGKPFDEFGKHIISLSEEMAKLRKFKNYMGRSAVMAESLSDYTVAVNERIATVKKTIENLQKKTYYTETFEAFAPAVMEDVPEDISSNWIEQLTIKQFNEELKDIFPYIYKLVSEVTKPTVLGPDDLAEVAGPDKCWDGYKKDGTQKGTGKNKGKRVNKCVPEDAELEQGFEEMMGQFGEAEEETEVSSEIRDKIGAWIATFDTYIGGNGDTLPEGYLQWALNSGITTDFVETNEADAMIKKHGEDKFENDPMSFIDEMPITKACIDELEAITGNDDLEDNAKIIDQVMNSDGNESGDDLPDGHAEPNEQKTPLGEFILSYFDKESGQFPKGETAVLTMIEKDYGEQFIEPAKAFIESVTAKFEEFQMRTQPQQMEPGSDESNTEALKMNKYGDMEGMPEPDESMADLSRSMMQPKLADALAKAADVNRKDVYFDDADLVWGSKTVVQSCLADKECTFQHAVDELKKFANSNPKAETQNMDRMRELAGLR